MSIVVWGFEESEDIDDTPNIGGKLLHDTSAMGFYAAAFVVLYGAALLLASIWPALGPYGDTLMFAALGTACFINFGRNRTLHCGITGPIFLIGAVAAALIESGRWPADLSIVWAVVLLGVGIAFAVEWRTTGQNGSSTASVPSP